jgi:lysophospholipase L1-like esterase
LLLSLFGLALAAGALEVGVRALHLEPDRFWEADPLTGSRHIAGKSGWWTQEDREFVTAVQINEQGLRDVSRPLEKPRGTLRLLVLGDSFAEALQVPLEQSFARLLEVELNRLQGAHVEVVNAGISGFGTAGELLLLRRDGARYRPDVVLLAFFPGNDVMNNSPELETTLVPVYAEDGTLERVVSSKKPRPLRGILRKALARSKAYQYLRRRLVTGHPDLARRVGLLRGADEPASGDGVPAGYRVYAPADVTWQSAWAHTQRLLEALQAETRRLGAKLVVVVVTSREEVYPQYWEEVRQTYPAMQQGTWDVDAPRRRVVELCRQRGIPVLELAPIMRARRDGEPLHFHRDGHWTAAGHRVAAGAMANFLVKEGILAKNTEENHEVH